MFDVLATGTFPPLRLSSEVVQTERKPSLLFHSRQLWRMGGRQKLAGAHTDHILMPPN